jgi:Arc/MetJ-type ribon-helix-helix transcriptional regulator
MIRMQVQLTEEQHKQLKILAAERGCSASELVRQGVESLLGELSKASREEKWQRALAVIGSFSSAATDVSERHDDYFADSILDYPRRTE